MKKFIIGDEKFVMKRNERQIRNQFRDSDIMCEVFLGIYKSNPSLKSEIKEYTMIPDPTIYNNIYKLSKLGLVAITYVKKAKIGKTKLERAVWKKFQRWSKNMTESARTYYFLRTRMFSVTKLGEEFVPIVCGMCKIDCKENDGK